MIFDREPVLITSLIRAAIVLATAFGLRLDPAQIGALLLFSEAVLGFVVRSTVTSPATAAQLVANALPVTGGDDTTPSTTPVTAPSPVVAEPV